MDGEFRTQTGKPNRGKGLPSINDLAHNNKIKDFHIISGGGHCWINENGVFECGDLSNKIVVTGKVDTSKAGTYKITYTVEDAAKNKATVTRTIIVKAEEVVVPEKPIVPEKPEEEPDNNQGENTGGGNTGDNEPTTNENTTVDTTIPVE